MFSFFGTTSKFRTFADANMPAFSLRKIADMLFIYNENTWREKLQIIYANIRV